MNSVSRFWMPVVVLGVLAVVAAFLLIPQAVEAQFPKLSDNSISLAPGQKALLHAAPDVAIELFVDSPKELSEFVMYMDPETGKPNPLPNRATFRAQGRVVVQRDANSKNPGNVLVRWQYVEGMNVSYSRQK